MIELPLQTGQSDQRLSEKKLPSRDKKRVLLLSSVDSSAAPAHVLSICCVLASHLETRRTDWLLWKCGNLRVVLRFFFFHTAAHFCLGANQQFLCLGHELAY